MKIPPSFRWKPTGRTLGQGGQATVVEVTDSTGQHSGRFALKGLATGRPLKAYQRFEKEVAAINTVDHPSVIRIVDHSAPEAAFQYYVMELFDTAKSLKKLLDTHNNPFFQEPLAALGFCENLLNAIQAWHEKGIVHRDLSPSNVLILPDHSIKVIDFGICQIIDSESVTSIDEGIGTQNYMAPECESGAEGDITIAADFYSVGKLLWTAITNLSAFSRESPVFISKTMRSQIPNDPQCWHLHHIFERTIRHLPKDRWLDFSDALQTVRKVRFLIRSRYQPIELIGEQCPLCGFGNLKDFQGSHMVFGNPIPNGISAGKCNYCGFCFAHGTDAVQVEMTHRKSLS
ncbi:MAG: serine/threonine-protein kinase [Pirellulaceae bacterium]|nr:serine/threonine-protein kinase [Pirellulaceae bacterium]